MQHSLQSERQILWERCDECGVCGARRSATVFAVNQKVYVKCAKCGVVRLYDRVAPETLGEIYDDYYQSDDAQLTASQLNDQLKNPTFAFRRKRLEAFTSTEDRSFYEVGCGDGNFLAHLKNFGWRVGGCEFSQRTVEMVGRRHGVFVDLPKGIEIPGEPGSLANLGAYHVFEHLYEPRRWLKSVRRALKAGGHLHLQVPNFACPDRFLARDCWASLCFPQHVYFYSPRNLAALLESEGLKPLSTVTYDPWHSPGSMLITAKNVARKAITGKTPWNEYLPNASPSQPSVPGHRNPVVRILSSFGYPVAVIASRSQSAFGFGNVIDVIARAS
jgi:SAM-dependent methyltransferase